MKQRTQAPVEYPSRAPVGDPNDWNDGAYMPSVFEAGILVKPGKLPPWADPPHVYHQTEIGQRLCYDEATKKTMKVVDKCPFDEFTQRFKNPMGKTGIRGRGLLGKFGPNHAADVIVTRTTADGTHLALLCTKKVGDGKSALCWPAGMVEPGHTVPQTLRKELTEEALEDSDAVDRLFDECQKERIHAGFVDDYRNTDDAWMETVAQHFHATEDIATALRLSILDTDEIEKVAWCEMDKVSDMYASHAVWLRSVLDTLQADEVASAPLKKKKTHHSLVDGNESEVDEPLGQMLAAKESKLHGEGDATDAPESTAIAVA